MEWIEERQIVSGAITDWTSVTIDLAQHRGKYLTRVTVSNATTGTTQERGSVGTFHLRAKARSINTMLQTITLRDLDLFGYYETLDWEGSVLLDEVDDLQAHWVPVTEADVILIRAIISDVPSSHKSMDKPPRQRLLTAYSNMTTGAGTNSITLTCPVGRRWRLINAQWVAEEGAIAMYFYQGVDASNMMALVREDGNTAQTSNQWPPYTGTGGTFVPDMAVGVQSMTKERCAYVARIFAAAANKYFRLWYCILEEPDAKYPAPT